MIKLEPFTKDDFASLKSWIRNEQDLNQFAGDIFKFPLTDEQLEDSINLRDIKPFKIVLEENGNSIGHCELNFLNGNNRISRILIGSEIMRGKKLGEQIVKKMIELIALYNSSPIIDLNVFFWNKRAIACYKKVGFKPNPAKSTTYQFKNYTWDCINMELHLR